MVAFLFLFLFFIVLTRYNTRSSFVHFIKRPKEPPTFATPPPPRSGEKNPMFRRNVPASRFFSKRGSRCPGSQSQGANTPSFWLFGSWSNVETQSIPQFAKKNFHLSVSIWFLVSSLSEPATGPVDMQ